MLDARPPTLEEPSELRRMTREALGRVRQRAHLLVRSAPRSTVPVWATRLGRRRATVRGWRRPPACTCPTGPRMGRR